jgi:hypothetical protein
MASPNLRVHNSFEEPNALAPKDVAVTVASGTVRHTFPAASVTRLDVTLV